MLSQNDLMKKYPEVKRDVWYIMQRYREQDFQEEFADGNPYFDTWARIHDQEEELYNFLETCIAHDSFQLKHMEITPAEEMESYNLLTKLQQKYIRGNFVNMREVYLTESSNEARQLVNEMRNAFYKPCPDQL